MKERQHRGIPDVSAVEEPKFSTKGLVKDDDKIAVPDWIEDVEKHASLDFEYKTPSDAPFSVFVMCQPIHVETTIANNVWMKNLSGDKKEIDDERFMGEWFNFYKLLSADALVYLLPPKKGLQDQVYVNCFAYLPHTESRNDVVLSNFTAEGRDGEEDVAKELLSRLGYKCVKPPYKFEGYPELKFLKDNVYFGGHGIRTDIKALKWIEEKYGCTIIPMKEEDEKLYHLDCSLFIIDEKNVVVCTELYDKATIKLIEKVADIHSVSKTAAYESVCNSVRVGDMVLTSSSLMFMQKRDSSFQKEWKKNSEMEKICEKVGVELMFLEMGEAAKSGAALSCMCAPLNVRY